MIDNITVRDKTLIITTAKSYRKILVCAPNGMKPIKTPFLHTISAACAFITMRYSLDRKTVPLECSWIFKKIFGSLDQEQVTPKSLKVHEK